MEKASGEGGPTEEKQIMIVARNQNEERTQKGCQDESGRNVKSSQ